MSIINRIFSSLDQCIASALARIAPEVFAVPALDILGPHEQQHRKRREEFDIRKIFDGFLNAVPTKRVSIYRRRSRNIGAENWHWKMYKPKYNLLVCQTCGHHHEANCLCANCYNRIKEETEAMQAAMIKEFGWTPVDKDVAIVYENEKETLGSEELQNKRIVEMKKPRPQWFSKNLLQRSHGTPNADVTIPVKPSDLG